MIIRKATLSDFDQIYKLGLESPEINVAGQGEFADKDELEFYILDAYGIFLVAENDDGEIIGFTYATSDNLKYGFESKYASLWYLIVAPRFQRHGIGLKLHEARINALRDMGITTVGVFCNVNSGIIPFHLKNGFTRGQTYTFMQKEII